MDMESKNRLVTIIGSIALAMCSVVLMYLAVVGFLISFKDYEPLIGFAKSEFMGLLYYKRFLKSDLFAQAMSSSTAISFIEMFFGALYVFFATLATGSIKRSVPKSMVAIFFALPLAIPTVVLGGLVAPRIDGRMFSLLISAVLGGLPLAALFSLGGLFVKKAPTRSALKLAVVFAALKLVLFFTDNFAFLNMMSAYSDADTFSSTAYRVALLQGEFSYGTAMEVVRCFFTLIPAALGCLILIVYMKEHNEKRNEHIRRKSASSLKRFAAFVSLMPLLLALIVFLKSFGYGFYINQFGLNYLNSIIISFFTTVTGVVFIFLMANAVRNLGAFGVIAICLLCVVAENTIGQFFAIRLLHRLNTRTGVVLMNLRCIPVFTLVFAIFIRMKDTLAARLAILPLAIASVFAFSWGNHTSALILMSDQRRYPVSLLVKGIFAQDLRGVVNLSVYVFMPLIILVLCVVASVVIMRSREE